VQKLALFRNSRWLWLLISFSIPLYFGAVTLLHCWNQPACVQDDARQHVAFLSRFLDPQLFLNDPIADYFQAVAPAGYRTLYWLAAQIGIAPLYLAQLLPLILGLITTGYTFGLCLQIFPIPFAGFLAVLILNQQIWLDDSLVSATPRAFIYPIFVAFLYYLIRRSWLPCLITLLLQGLFFPQLVLVQSLVVCLRPLQFRHRSIEFNWTRVEQRFTLLALLVSATVLAPYLLNPSSYGAAITRSQMLTMPEYRLGGRNEYFGVSAWQFWLLGNSGIRLPWFPSLSLVGLGLPLVKRFRWPLVHLIQPQIRLIAEVIAASLVLYMLAHLLLLKLHFPSRYTYHTFRIALAVTAGIVLTIMLDAGWGWWQRVRKNARLADRALAGLGISLILVVVIVPAIPDLLTQFQGWVISDATELYDYLRQQPQQTLVASIATEASNIPALAQRPTLTGREFALPHHPSYYQIFQQRTVDALQVLYTTQPSQFQQIVEKYGIDFLLIESNFDTPDYLLHQDWLLHSSFQNTVQGITEQLTRGEQPAVSLWIKTCTVASTDQFRLLSTNCIQNHTRF
jgi:hypothetical protein